MEYDRMQLLVSEREELLMLKRSCPFRQWFAVKALNNEAHFFDSKRKANTFAAKHVPATIYGAQ